MKAIVCEMCGSHDLVKKDGMYVCESCGTKYSVEEAKRLMVDVSGSTIKIDTSDELENLLELARRARDDNNSENARKYYEQVLIKNPSSWEAQFYSVYYQAMDTTIAGISNSAVRITNCEDTVLKLLKENVEDVADQKLAIMKMQVKLNQMANMFMNATTDHYGEIDSRIRDRYRGETGERFIHIRDILIRWGDLVSEFFKDDESFLVNTAAAAWQNGIKMDLLAKKVMGHSDGFKIDDYVEKIKKYNSDYENPNTKSATASSGCYVATAVYGSYDCPEVWTLRRYRDYNLAKTWYGRAFVRMYYAISPTLVKWFGHTVWFKKMWRGKLDRMVKNLQNQGYESTPYEDLNW